MIANKLGLVLALALPAASCISTQEMPLSENTWRIQTEAGGTLFVGETANHTLKRAAELTLQQGYTHFRIVDSAMQTGSEVAGYIPGQARTTVNVVGHSAYGTTTYTPGYVVHAPVASMSAIVVMYRAGDPGSEGALSAEQILQRKS